MAGGDDGEVGRPVPDEVPVTGVPAAAATAAPDGPADEGDDAGQRACEVLAALVVFGVVALLLQGHLRALAEWRQMAGWSDRSLLEYLGIASTGSYLGGFLLVPAYLLVMAGPGRVVGRLGTGALQALRVLGAVVVVQMAVLGLWTVGEGHSGLMFPLEPGGFTQEVDEVARALDRAATLVPLLGSAAVAAGVAWVAHRALRSLFDVDPDTDIDGDEDAGEDRGPGPDPYAEAIGRDEG